MEPIAQVVTMLTMFIGRVGPVSLAISLSTYKNEDHSRTVLPSGDITVG